MPTYSRRAIIVIPAADIEAANAWMKANFDREGGEYSFTVLLSNGGVASHAACNTACTDGQYAAFVAEFGADNVYDANNQDYPAVLSELSMTVAE